MATSIKYPTANTATTGFNGIANSPTDAYTDNATYANFVPTKPRNDEDAHCWSGFDFSGIPGGSTINSVTVKVQEYMSASNSVGQWRVTLWADATSGSALTDTAPTNSIGGSNYTRATTDTTEFEWDLGTLGTEPTLAQLQAAGFGVRIEVAHGNTATSYTYYVDTIEITVDYTSITPQSISANTASETEAAQNVTLDLTTPVTVTTETETAQAVSILQPLSIGVVASSETETAQAIAPAQQQFTTVTVATETETTQPATLDLTTPVTGVSETEAAQATTANVTTTVTTATETEAAQVAIAKVAQTTGVTAAGETETANAVTVFVDQSITASVASETETVVAVAIAFSVPMGTASETETVQAVTLDLTVPVGGAAEAETAQAVALLTGTVANVVTSSVNEFGKPVGIGLSVGVVTETEATYSLHGHRSILTAAESETVYAVQVLQGQSIVVGVVAEAETAQLASIGLSAVAVEETEATSDVQVNVSIPVGAATEVDNGKPVQATTIVTVQVVATYEAETAIAVAVDAPGATQDIPVGVVTETEVARSVNIPSGVAITSTTETEAAQQVVTIVTVPVGVASETEATSQAISGRTVLVGPSAETETILAVPTLVETFIVVTVAGEVVSVTSIGFGLSVSGTAETETATAATITTAESFPYRMRTSSRENKTSFASRENKTTSSTRVGGVQS